ncbi:MAG: hypothetical protein DI535_20520 [Citrobacter freundii]|nr:MAG: hypothetical protein DI535_20520 [Citrobacter freundii]
MRLMILTLSLFTSAAVSAQSPSTAEKPDDFEKSVSSGKQLLLDVRTEKEFRSGHLAGAMQANWNDTAEFRQRIQHIDPKQPIYVYCLAGARSASAARWMRSHGFVNVIELEGGINAWKAAGKGLENAAVVKQISKAELEAMIPKNQTTLVDIGADWCPPCRKMQPVIEGLKKDTSLHFELVNIDAGVQTAIQQQLNTKAIPVFIIYKNGKEVWRGEGVISTAELKKQLL